MAPSRNVVARRPRSLLAAASTALLFIAACRVSGPSPRIGSADLDAIRALDSAYVAGWLANDSAAVLATLDSDVVLMPAGSRPVIGREAARAFWWPSDGSRTTITDYIATIDEIAGTPALAYLRGTSTLDFTYERDTVRSTGASRTMTLTLVAKGADGRWRIARRMWGPLAGQ